jgi:hypothetical protein
MPTHVIMSAADFEYEKLIRVGDDSFTKGLGIILVGRVTNGVAAPRMNIEIGSKTIPILGVECYDPDLDIFGLLVLRSAVMDGYDAERELHNNVGKTFKVTQKYPLAKDSTEEGSTFDDSTFGEVLASALGPARSSMGVMS